MRNVQFSWFVAGLLPVLLLQLDASPGRSEDAPNEPKASAPAVDIPARSWHSSLPPAIEEARVRQVPILLRVGATWCGWCRKLDQEIETPAVQQELTNWVLVELDADEDADAVRRLNVGPIPALRILNTSGRVTKALDGFQTSDELITWLRSRDEVAEQDLVDLLTEVPELSLTTLPQLVRLMGHREISVRAAVAHQLAANQNVAGAAVVQAFIQGNLATRLLALEILGGWKAPIEELDPWQAETLTSERLKRIEEWVEAWDPAQVTAPVEMPLSSEQLVEARSEIARLLSSDPSEVEAIGTRLARFGQLLLPEVKEQRQAAQTDLARERLDWLRYRLVASDALALRWPGGLAKLASMDPQARHDAIVELPRVASHGEESLLIELFGHPDPLVRELSLKTLHTAGGAKAHSELTRLLSDPEPNVRAAVLKQLAESPATVSVSQISEYITREQDEDLIVQAVRLLREVKRKDSIDCLIQLFQHAMWPVRAEAVEAVGVIVSDRDAARGNSGVTPEVIADAYSAILKALNDPDGYVVSRGVLALKNADLAIAIPPLIRAAEAHAELALPVADALTYGGTIRKQAAPILKTWLRHDNAAFRTAAWRSLSRISELDGEADLIPALSDPNESVRIMAAEQLLSASERLRPSIKDAILQSPGAEVTKPPAEGDLTDGYYFYETWLAAFRSGVERPKWMEQAREPLVRMLGAASQDEQWIAGVMLVALGDQERAPQELLRLATEQRHLLTSVAKSLRWLPWTARQEQFGRLRELTTDSNTLAALCDELVVLHDVRASVLLWKELSAENMTADLAHSIFAAIVRNHGLDLDPGYGYDSLRAPVGVQSEALSALAKSGPIWQRRVATAFLMFIDSQAAQEVAKAIVADENTVPELRSDAFQVLLQVVPLREQQRLAVTAISDSKSSLFPPAIAFLAQGRDGVRFIGNGEFELPQRSSDSNSLASAARPPLPKDLTIELVQPAMESSNPETVAQGAYLLSMLGRPDGLERLLSNWRNSRATNSSEQWEPLLIEAIAASKDASYVPVIEEIYQDMHDRRPHEIRTLYWTIRSMTGPEILRLRKKIRDEVGMESLR
jgi:HEAT repeat protein